MKKLLIIFLSILTLYIPAIAGEIVDSDLKNATIAGEVEKVKKILDGGAEVDVADRHGLTPVFWAVYYNEVEITELLLKHKANPNIMDKELKITPLSWAVTKDMPEILEMLLAHGADVDFKENGQELIYFAFRNFKSKSAQLLIAKLAVDGYTDKNGYSALSRAIRTNDFEFVSLLIEKGADVNPPSKKGNRMPPIHEAIAQGNIAIFDLLVENGADLATIYIDDNDAPLLYTAVRYDKWEFIEKLVKLGVDVDVRSKDGKTALIQSIHSDISITKMLVGLGADIHVKDKFNLNMLHWSALRMSAPHVKLMLEYGIDPDIRSNYYREAGTALEMAEMDYYKDMMDPEVIRLLKEVTGKTCKQRGGCNKNMKEKKWYNFLWN